MKLTSVTGADMRQACGACWSSELTLGQIQSLIPERCEVFGISKDVQVPQVGYVLVPVHVPVANRFGVKVTPKTDDNMVGLLTTAGILQFFVDDTPGGSIGAGPFWPQMLGANLHSCNSTWEIAVPAGDYFLVVSRYQNWPNSAAGAMILHGVTDDSYRIWRWTDGQKRGPGWDQPFIGVEGPGDGPAEPRTATVTIEGGTFADPPVDQGPLINTFIYSYTGTVQTFVAPAGTRYLTLDGTGAGGSGGQGGATTPGRGQRVVVQGLRQNAGFTAEIRVGGAAGGRNGGYNGGGTAGTTSGGFDGGGGGGATDMRAQFMDATQRYFVAAGGAGAGAFSGTGGDAGYPAGKAGTGSVPSGQGGTQTAGGAGGGSGANGVLAQGGPSANAIARTGGGGGAGLFGGGGGSDFGGGGGGGGSSYYGPNGSEVITFYPPTNTGHGILIISCYQ